jgi:hypothetical protein
VKLFHKKVAKTRKDKITHNGPKKAAQMVGRCEAPWRGAAQEQTQETAGAIGTL